MLERYPAILLLLVVIGSFGFGSVMQTLQITGDLGRTARFGGYWICVMLLIYLVCWLWAHFRIVRREE